jgi:hypothetical protein
MYEAAHWNIGDVIVFRGVSQSKIWYALPVFLIQDSPTLIALYWPSGTRGKFRMKPSGERVTPQDVILTPMDSIDYTWKKTDVLMLITPGAAHAVYVMWKAGQKKLLCWYINLQDPIRRTPIGFDTEDHMLDIVFSSDKSNYHWKDEDHLADAVTLGIFTVEKARQIHSEGERVIQLIRENQSPFCDAWEKWSPPADWKIPDLPAQWNTGFSK